MAAVLARPARAQQEPRQQQQESACAAITAQLGCLVLSQCALALCVSDAETRRRNLGLPAAASDAACVAAEAHEQTRKAKMEPRGLPPLPCPADNQNPLNPCGYRGACEVGLTWCRRGSGGGKALELARGLVKRLPKAQDDGTLQLPADMPSHAAALEALVPEFPRWHAENAKKRALKHRDPRRGA